MNVVGGSDPVTMAVAEVASPAQTEHVTSFVARSYVALVPAGITTWQLWQAPAWRSLIRLVVGSVGTDMFPRV
jgi:hypothetical protein